MKGLFGDIYADYFYYILSLRESQVFHAEGCLQCKVVKKISYPLSLCVYAR